MSDVAKLLGVVSYLVVLILIGVAASRRMRGISDFVAAGKNLRFFSVAFSARATGESAWLLIGLTGMGATVGVHAFLVVLGELLGVGGAWLLMARPFKRLTDKYDSLTIPDYLESRFGDTKNLLRGLAAFSLVVFVTIYVSAQIDATGQAFEKFLDWDYFFGAILGFAIVVAYTTCGGFLAVVWSDVFQGMMMVLGLVALPVTALVSVGGFAPVLDGLAAQDADLVKLVPDTSATGIAAVIALVGIGIGFMGSPQIFARFVALRNEDEIGRGTAVALTWTLLADAGAVVIGLCARHILDIENEDALPGLVEHLMPALLVGLYIAIVLAAIMSTADSLLVLAASALVHDVYQKIKAPDASEQELVRKSRLATIVLAIAALAVSLGVALFTKERSVFWFVVFGWSGIAATFCPTMILSLFWKGFTTRGAVAAMITGFVCVPFFKFATVPDALDWPVVAALGELVPSFIVSALAGVLVSLSDREAPTS